MKKSPIEVIRAIQEQFSSFIEVHYQVDDPDYQPQIREQLKKVTLFKGPFVRAELPFSSGKSLIQLEKEGIVDHELLEIKKLQPQRALYLHQESALRKVSSGKNVIITTGTGSGKTESFLLPVLNKVLQMKKDEEKYKGVKAIFLYPMNALVNDQLDRIRELLKDCPEITFGRYIGETPERLSALERRSFEFPSNELRSREQLRDNPPDILITNYSMLEYLMLRPDDASIINDQSMQFWNFMVLDEAHTYSGTKASELAYLLRRLEGFTGRTPQYILTSATLGTKDTIDKIVRFGHDLTSATFEEDDVVFASRRYLKTEEMVNKPDPLLYSQLRELTDNPDCGDMDLGQLQKNCVRKKLESDIYHFLEKDERVRKIYELATQTSPFSAFFCSLPDLTEKQITDLIHLIQFAKLPDGSFLFDIKYHFFISTPSRAFITLAEPKKIRFGNFNQINGFKAFEIGRCENCNHLYLVGNIINGILENSDTLEAYEDYEDDQRQLQIFSLTPEESPTLMIEYSLCAKCGRIHKSSQLNAKKCQCGEEFLRSVYEIDQSIKKRNSIRNNLTQCAHCGRHSTRGVLQTFKLDRNTATSVLGNIYLEALNNGIKKLNSLEDIVEENSDVFGCEPSKDKWIDDSSQKQILCFSDGRQQASYFAVKMGNEHDRMLSRKLILEELQGAEKIFEEQQKDEKPTFSPRNLAHNLEKRIREEDLFEGDPLAMAWIAVLRDLFSLEGKKGAEAMGLYRFQIRSTSKMGKLEKVYEDNCTKIESYFDMSVSEFRSLVDFCVDHLRKEGAINYSEAELTHQQKGLLFPYSPCEKTLVMKKEGVDRKGNQIGFLPAKSKNKLSSYLVSILGISEEEAKIKLNLLFNFLCKVGILETIKNTTPQQYRINVKEFEIVLGEKVKWYQCDCCCSLSPINIRGICQSKDCKGRLHLCDPKKVLQDNFYRKRYTEVPVDRVVVKEHTAQLDKQKAQNYQNDFKNKKINVLSCSTTFEVGVDIGSLENVMLRNVPPSPANYVQRAGRAGRGNTASALVMTYCLNRSHDYSYFMEPEAMINGIVQPPVFSLINEKIVLRHLVATAFSFYFRKHPSLFNDKDFVYQDKLQPFCDFLMSKDPTLGSFLDKWLLREPELSSWRNFGWIDAALGQNGSLRFFQEGITERRKEYDQAMEYARKCENYGEMQDLSNELKRFENTSLIQILSSYSVIPKYGFPVDVVELKVFGHPWKDNPYDLSRDLRVAIGEYAPSSEVVVDKKIYTSRYINIPKIGALEKEYYFTCSHCNATTIQVHAFHPGDKCSHCGREITDYESRFIIPSLGFTTSSLGPREATRKPIRKNRSRIGYIGDGEIVGEEVNYKDRITIQNIRKDKLAVINESGFWYCPLCGYTETSIKKKGPHYNKRQEECPNQRLEKIALGHLFMTDVIKMTLHLPDLEQHAVETTGFAILEGMSHVLQIDRRDIDAIVIGRQGDGYDLLLFDTVPGGAGYVSKLMDLEVLKNIMEMAFNIVNRNCCAPDTTCYSCLRNYYKEPYHRYMKREDAQTILRNLLSPEIRLEGRESEGERTC